MKKTRDLDEEDSSKFQFYTRLDLFDGISMKINFLQRLKLSHSIKKVKFCLHENWLKKSKTLEKFKISNFNPS